MAAIKITYKQDGKIFKDSFHEIFMVKINKKEKKSTIGIEVYHSQYQKNAGTPPHENVFLDAVGDDYEKYFDDNVAQTFLPDDKQKVKSVTESIWQQAYNFLMSVSPRDSLETIRSSKRNIDCSQVERSKFKFDYAKKGQKI